ncbi:MAG TPA: nitronate monooxygenase [bacterium]|nr:nitronate monooxygenase [bacterium]HOL48015.1 nitronate monooxygenase [bacterium]HPQ19317.1 nitronate monooxygenase [bacterium]
MFKEIEIRNTKFKNPIFIASGTGGFGDSSLEIDYSLAGAFITKTITYYPRAGNPPPRILEVIGGLLNFVGLENPGFFKFIEILKSGKIKVNTNYIVSISAANKKELKEMIEGLEQFDFICGYEINLSCPNVKHKTIMPFLNKNYIKEIVKNARKLTKKFFSMKLPPYTGIEYAPLCEEYGADAVTLNNTYPGVVYYEDKKFISGGISGPVIKPMMLYNIFQTAKLIKIPIIASGGIQNYKDVEEALNTGAKAVQIGSINFIYPDAIKRILNKEL